ncbi:MAG: CHASE domain-containing protein, partial [Betaproteobacteria bacterium]|nr:CHASE domain-containing protein [Betaproteobacteria bacterium]
AAPMAGAGLRWRAALEREARADGAPGFRITAVGPDGVLRPEPARSEYFPVYYVEPLHGNRAALGFDLRSNPVRRQALELAAGSGSMVATARIVLVQDPHGSYGFLVFYPVFDGDGAGQRGNLRGFVLGVFSIGSLVGGDETNALATSPTGSPRLRLAVFDQTGGAPGQTPQELYPRGLRETPARLLRSPMIYQRMIEVGQRQWRVLAYAGAPGSTGSEAGIVFGTVLLATLLIAVLMRQVELVRESETRRIVAQRADEAKSRFVAKVSHEVRTPLNGVVGMLELLLHSPLPPAERRMAEVSHRSAVSLLGIVNDLLDFSKIEAGKLALVDEVVDLHALVSDVTELYADAATHGDCSLSARIGTDVPRHIRGDAGRLRQVLSNLVSNAVKFSSHQGRPGEVRVQVRRLGDASAPQLAISVHDNGVGMDASTLERLFRPFEQARGANAPRGTGTGLGLAISHELVAAMGGRLQASSRPGHGSLLRVTLPLREAGDVQARLPTPTPAGPSRLAARMPVLVAEDNPTNREVIALQLRHLGVQARITHDGAGALRCWEEGSYGALLTDLHMPGMDGLALAREIRRRESLTQRPRMPIIALTAAAGSEELAQAMASGMDLHLAKPVELDALRAALAGVLGGDAPHETPDGHAGADEGGEPGAGAIDEPEDGRAPCLEVARLHRLVGDDPAVVDSLLRQYAEELRDSLESLQAAALDADVARLGELAHRLKSSSRTVGAEELGQACEQLEGRAREHTGAPPAPDVTAAWLQTVRSAATRVERALAARPQGAG